MPHSRYTRFVHTIEQYRRVHQEKELARLARQLRNGTAEPMILPVAVGVKERRTTRLEQKRLHASNDPELAPSVLPIAPNSPDVTVA